MVDREQQEQFQTQYQGGINAFNRGQYRLSVQNLEEATQLVNLSTRLGGEVQLWLVNAYQAAERLEEAIALCRQLTTHPNTEIRQQSKQVLYIIAAPRLQRPQEWLTKIPELEKSSEKNSQYVTANPRQKETPKSAVKFEDFSQMNTKDNYFIWVALLLILLLLGGVIWLNY